ncbi:MarR family transcriptional regulator [Clostridium carboxidivorans P7]|uniref:Transcriptional regulator, MarR family n=1 Tax=Clostridium carboxidivorans P7 TaxID=536227 RepID=C6Q1R2_9CLOT|nr:MULTISPECIES: MarR family transcriptional regulator [Clostridium]AKN33327.1 MarR family transcriptional regulator [Clostridium carboxidivorans P7]EET84578.1 transcriptional regulator, MarR family [Clostridium carboxidivorans P7]WPC42112.1 MarR family transcriptional regulator [Clostridium sp. JS66]
MITSLDKSIGMSINYVNKKIQRYLSINLEKYDITTEQWAVLLKLVEKEGINQKLLSKEVEKDQATLTRILDILERKSLIIRKKSPEDRRAFLIYTTDKGKEVKEEVYPFIEKLFKNMICGIPKDELDLFVGVLSKINENMCTEEQKIKQCNKK